MARSKKDSVAITVRLDREVFDLLERYAADSGQTKTVAVERAIRMYAEDYYKKYKMLDSKG